MKSVLQGKPVKHDVFGKGLITDVSDSIVTVLFSQGEKKFMYPEAFLDFLTLKDSAVQKKIQVTYFKQQESERAIQKREQEKRTLRRKMMTRKIHPASQGMFHVSLAEINQIVNKGVLSAGKLLSGYSKGEPRIPQRIMPNSACILTAIPKNQTEKERRIYAIMMADTEFCGACSEDGHILCHNTYRFRLPEKQVLRYWDYFPHDDHYPAWGRVPIKYFENNTMLKILDDLLDKYTGSPQEEKLGEFYNYFCQMNHFPVKQAEKEED